MRNRLIDNLDLPNDIRSLKKNKLKQLSNEVRDIIKDLSRTKDIHFSSNLGIVELTVSLLHNFDPLKDYFLFDTGHQTYTYKILTDRKDRIYTIKDDNGLSGLMNMKESRYDKYSPGHSGNILSIASGIYQKYKNQNISEKGLYKNNKNIVTIIGDSAFANGLNFEALNDVSFNNEPIIIVLNDNGMSISKSVGYMTKSLNKIKSIKLHHLIERLTRKVLGFSKMYKAVLNTFNFFQWRIYGKNIFENLGYQYIGPVNGHNIKELNIAFERAKWFAKQGPVIVHVKTKKGKGDEFAEKDKDGEFHSLSVKAEKTLGMFATDYLLELMEKHKDIYVINPAMSKSSNCHLISQKYPHRFNDVGIAEEHALSKASGISLSKSKPYIYIYSTFLQRCYDQLIHDLYRLNLGCCLLIDRADLSGGEGSSHHGIYDVAMLKNIPNAIICNVRNKEQLKELIKMSYGYIDKYIFSIRYSKNYHEKININNKIVFGKWEWFEKHKTDVVIISYGTYINEIYQQIYNQYDVNLINATFISFYDESEIKSLFRKYKKIIVYERIFGDHGLYYDLIKYKENHDFKNQIIPMHYKSIINSGTTDFLDAQENMDLMSIKKIVKKCLK